MFDFDGTTTKYFSAALKEVDQNMRKSAKNANEYAIWSSWAVGAWKYYSSLLNEFALFRKPPKSRDGGKLLFELFMQPMISGWYYYSEANENKTEHQKYEDRRSAFLSIQTFLSMPIDSTVKSMKFCLGFDKEFELLMKKETKPPFNYMRMFHQRLWECILEEEIVFWLMVPFPINTYSDFHKWCNTKYIVGIANDERKLLRAYVLMQEALNFMFNRYKEKVKSNS